ncbi:hypothetical protein RCL1_005180 [Eukaryota sp. TZLM3-RCL]
MFLFSFLLFSTFFFGHVIGTLHCNIVTNSSLSSFNSPHNSCREFHIQNDAILTVSLDRRTVLNEIHFILESGSLVVSNSHIVLHKSCTITGSGSLFIENSVVVFSAQLDIGSSLSVCNSIVEVSSPVFSTFDLNLTFNSQFSWISEINFINFPVFIFSSSFSVLNPLNLSFLSLHGASSISASALLNVSSFDWFGGLIRGEFDDFPLFISELIVYEGDYKSIEDKIIRIFSILEQYASINCKNHGHVIVHENARHLIDLSESEFISGNSCKYSLTGSINFDSNTSVSVPFYSENSVINITSNADVFFNSMSELNNVELFINSLLTINSVSSITFNNSTFIVETNGKLVFSESNHVYFINCSFNSESVILFDNSFADFQTNVFLNGVLRFESSTVKFSNIFDFISNSFSFISFSNSFISFHHSSALFPPIIVADDSTLEFIGSTTFDSLNVFSGTLIVNSELIVITNALITGGEFQGNGLLKFDCTSNLSNFAIFDGLQVFITGDCYLSGTISAFGDASLNFLSAFSTVNVTTDLFLLSESYTNIVVVNTSFKCYSKIFSSFSLLILSNVSLFDFSSFETASEFTLKGDFNFFDESSLVIHENSRIIIEVDGSFNYLSSNNISINGALELFGTAWFNPEIYLIQSNTGFIMIHGRSTVSPNFLSQNFNTWAGASLSSVPKFIIDGKFRLGIDLIVSFLHLSSIDFLCDSNLLINSQGYFSAGNAVLKGIGSIKVYSHCEIFGSILLENDVSLSFFDNSLSIVIDDDVIVQSNSPIIFNSISAVFDSSYTLTIDAVVHVSGFILNSPSNPTLIFNNPKVVKSVIKDLSHSEGNIAFEFSGLYDFSNFQISSSSLSFNSGNFLFDGIFQVPDTISVTSSKLIFDVSNLELEFNSFSAINSYIYFFSDVKFLELILVNSVSNFYSNALVSEFSSPLPDSIVHNYQDLSVNLFEDNLFTTFKSHGSLFINNFPELSQVSFEDKSIIFQQNIILNHETFSINSDSFLEVPADVSVTFNGPLVASLTFAAKVVVKGSLILNGNIFFSNHFLIDEGGILEINGDVVFKSFSNHGSLTVNSAASISFEEDVIFSETSEFSLSGKFFVNTNFETFGKVFFNQNYELILNPSVESSLLVFSINSVNDLLFESGSFSILSSEQFSNVFVKFPPNYSLSFSIFSVSSVLLELYCGDITVSTVFELENVELVGNMQEITSLSQVHLEGSLTFDNIIAKFSESDTQCILSNEIVLQNSASLYFFVDVLFQLPFSITSDNSFTYILFSDVSTSNPNNLLSISVRTLILMSDISFNGQSQILASIILLGTLETNSLELNCIGIGCFFYPDSALKTVPQSTGTTSFTIIQGELTTFADYIDFSSHFSFESDTFVTFSKDIPTLLPVENLPVSSSLKATNSAGFQLTCKGKFNLINYELELSEFTTLTGCEIEAASSKITVSSQFLFTSLKVTSYSTLIFQTSSLSTGSGNSFLLNLIGVIDFTVTSGCSLGLPSSTLTFKTLPVFSHSISLNFQNSVTFQGDVAFENDNLYAIPVLNVYDSLVLSSDLLKFEFDFYCHDCNSVQMTAVQGFTWLNSVNLVSSQTQSIDFHTLGNHIFHDLNLENVNFNSNIFSLNCQGNCKISSCSFSVTSLLLAPNSHLIIVDSEIYFLNDLTYASSSSVSLFNSKLQGKLVLNEDNSFFVYGTSSVNIIETVALQTVCISVFTSETFVIHHLINKGNLELLSFLNSFPGTVEIQGGSSTSLITSYTHLSFTTFSFNLQHSSLWMCSKCNLLIATSLTISLQSSFELTSREVRISTLGTLFFDSIFTTISLYTLVVNDGVFRIKSANYVNMLPSSSHSVASNEGSFQFCTQSCVVSLVFPEHFPFDFTFKGLFDLRHGSLTLSSSTSVVRFLGGLLVNYLTISSGRVFLENQDSSQSMASWTVLDDGSLFILSTTVLQSVSQFELSGKLYLRSTLFLNVFRFLNGEIHGGRVFVKQQLLSASPCSSTLLLVAAEIDASQAVYSPQLECTISGQQFGIVKLNAYGTNPLVFQGTGHLFLSGSANIQHSLTCSWSITSTGVLIISNSASITLSGSEVGQGLWTHSSGSFTLNSNSILKLHKLYLAGSSLAELFGTIEASEIHVYTPTAGISGSWTGPSSNPSSLKAYVMTQWTSTTTLIFNGHLILASSVVFPSISTSFYIIEFASGATYSGGFEHDYPSADNPPMYCIFHGNSNIMLNSYSCPYGCFGGTCDQMSGACSTCPPSYATSTFCRTQQQRCVYPKYSATCDPALELASTRVYTFTYLQCIRRLVEGMQGTGPNLIARTADTVVATDYARLTCGTNQCGFPFDIGGLEVGLGITFAIHRSCTLVVYGEVYLKDAANLDVSGVLIASSIKMDGDSKITGSGVVITSRISTNGGGIQEINPVVIIRLTGDYVFAPNLHSTSTAIFFITHKTVGEKRLSWTTPLPSQSSLVINSEHLIVDFDVSSSFAPKVFEIIGAKVNFKSLPPTPHHSMLFISSIVTYDIGTYFQLSSLLATSSELKISAVTVSNGVLTDSFINVNNPCGVGGCRLTATLNSKIYYFSTSQVLTPDLSLDIFLQISALVVFPPISHIISSFNCDVDSSFFIPGSLLTVTGSFTFRNCFFRGSLTTVGAASSSLTQSETKSSTFSHGTVDLNSLIAFTASKIFLRNADFSVKSSSDLVLPAITFTVLDYFAQQSFTLTSPLVTFNGDFATHNVLPVRLYTSVKTSSHLFQVPNLFIQNSSPSPSDLCKSFTVNNLILDSALSTCTPSPVITVSKFAIIHPLSMSSAYGASFIVENDAILYLYQPNSVVTLQGSSKLIVGPDIVLSSLILATSSSAAVYFSPGSSLSQSTSVSLRQNSLLHLSFGVSFSGIITESTGSTLVLESEVTVKSLTFNHGNMFFTGHLFVLENFELNLVPFCMGNCFVSTDVLIIHLEEFYFDFSLTTNDLEFISDSSATLLRPITTCSIIAPSNVAVTFQGEELLTLTGSFFVDFELKFECPVLISKDSAIESISLLEIFNNVQIFGSYESYANVVIQASHLYVTGTLLLDSLEVIQDGIFECHQCNLLVNDLIDCKGSSVKIFNPNFVESTPFDIYLTFSSSMIFHGKDFTFLNYLHVAQSSELFLTGIFRTKFLELSNAIITGPGQIFVTESAEFLTSLSFYNIYLFFSGTQSQPLSLTLNFEITLNDYSRFTISKFSSLQIVFPSVFVIRSDETDTVFTIEGDLELSTQPNSDIFVQSSLLFNHQSFSWSKITLVFTGKRLEINSPIVFDNCVLDFTGNSALFNAEISGTVIITSSFELIGDVEIRGSHVVITEDVSINSIVIYSGKLEVQSNLIVHNLEVFNGILTGHGDVVVGEYLRISGGNIDCGSLVSQTLASFTGSTLSLSNLILHGDSSIIASHVIFQSKFVNYGSISFETSNDCLIESDSDGIFINKEDGILKFQSSIIFDCVVESKGILEISINDGHTVEFQKSSFIYSASFPLAFQTIISFNHDSTLYKLSGNYLINCYGSIIKIYDEISPSKLIISDYSTVYFYNVQNFNGKFELFDSIAFVYDSVQFSDVEFSNSELSIFKELTITKAEISNVNLIGTGSIVFSDLTVSSSIFNINTFIIESIIINSDVPIHSKFELMENVDLVIEDSDLVFSGGGVLINRGQIFLTQILHSDMVLNFALKFINFGVITSTSDIVFSSSNFENFGQMFMNKGSLTIENTSDVFLFGLLEFSSPQSNLIVNSHSQVFIVSNFLLPFPSKFQIFEGSTVNINQGSFPQFSVLEINSADLIINEDVIIDNLTVSSGTISGYAALTVLETSSFSGNLFLGDEDFPPLFLELSGNVEILGDISLANCILINLETLVISSNDLVINSNSLFINSVNGIITITTSDLDISGAGLLVNYGVIEISSNTVFSSTVNIGTVLVNCFTLTLTGGGTSLGIFDLSCSNSLLLLSLDSFNFDGSITGLGLVKITGGSHVFSGFIDLFYNNEQRLLEISDSTVLFKNAEFSQNTIEFVTFICGPSCLLSFTSFNILSSPSIIQTDASSSLLIDEFSFISLSSFTHTGGVSGAGNLSVVNYEFSETATWNYAGTLILEGDFQLESHYPLIFSSTVVNNFKFLFKHGTLNVLNGFFINNGKLEISLTEHLLEVKIDAKILNTGSGVVDFTDFYNYDSIFLINKGILNLFSSKLQLTSVYDSDLISTGSFIIDENSELIFGAHYFNTDTAFYGLGSFIFSGTTTLLGSLQVGNVIISTNSPILVSPSFSSFASIYSNDLTLFVPGFQDNSINCIWKLKKGAVSFDRGVFSIYDLELNSDNDNSSLLVISRSILIVKNLKVSSFNDAVSGTGKLLVENNFEIFGGIFSLFHLETLIFSVTNIYDNLIGSGKGKLFNSGIVTFYNGNFTLNDKFSFVVQSSGKLLIENNSEIVIGNSDLASVQLFGSLELLSASCLLISSPLFVDYEGTITLDQSNLTLAHNSSIFGNISFETSFLDFRPNNNNFFVSDYGYWTGIGCFNSYGGDLVIIAYFNFNPVHEFAFIFENSTVSINQLQHDSTIISISTFSELNIRENNCVDFLAQLGGSVSLENNVFINYYNAFDGTLFSTHFPGISEFVLFPDCSFEFVSGLIDFSKKFSLFGFLLVNSDFTVSLPATSELIVAQNSRLTFLDGSLVGNNCSIFFELNSVLDGIGHLNFSNSSVFQFHGIFDLNSSIFFDSSTILISSINVLRPFVSESVSSNILISNSYLNTSLLLTNSELLIEVNSIIDYFDLNLVGTSQAIILDSIIFDCALVLSDSSSFFLSSSSLLSASRLIEINHFSTVSFDLLSCFELLVENLIVSGNSVVETYNNNLFVENFIFLNGTKTGNSSLVINHLDWNSGTFDCLSSSCFIELIDTGYFNNSENSLFLFNTVLNITGNVFLSSNLFLSNSIVNINCEAFFKAFNSFITYTHVFDSNLINNYGTFFIFLNSISSIDLDLIIHPKSSLIIEGTLIMALNSAIIFDQYMPNIDVSFAGVLVVYGAMFSDFFVWNSGSFFAYNAQFNFVDFNCFGGSIYMENPSLYFVNEFIISNCQVSLDSVNFTLEISVFNSFNSDFSLVNSSGVKILNEFFLYDTNFLIESLTLQFFVFNLSVDNSFLVFNSGFPVIFRHLNILTYSEINGTDLYVVLENFHSNFQISPELSCLDTRESLLTFSLKNSHCLINLMLISADFSTDLTVTFEPFEVQILLSNIYSFAEYENSLLLNFTLPEVLFSEIVIIPICKPIFFDINPHPQGGPVQIYGRFLGHLPLILIDSSPPISFLTLPFNHSVVTVAFSEYGACGHYFIFKRISDNSNISVNYCYISPFIESTSHSLFPLTGMLILYGTGFSNIFTEIFISNANLVYDSPIFEPFKVVIPVHATCNITQNFIEIFVSVLNVTSNSFNISLDFPSFSASPRFLSYSNSLIRLSGPNLGVFFDNSCSPGFKLITMEPVENDFLVVSSNLINILFLNADIEVFLYIELTDFLSVSLNFPVAMLIARDVEFVCLIRSKCVIIIDRVRLGIDLRTFSPNFDSNFLIITHTSSIASTFFIEFVPLISGIFSLDLCNFETCIPVSSLPFVSELLVTTEQYINWFDRKFSIDFSIVGNGLNYYDFITWNNSILINVPFLIQEVSTNTITIIVQVSEPCIITVNFNSNFGIIDLNFNLFVEDYLSFFPILPKSCTSVIHLSAPVNNLFLVGSGVFINLVSGSNLFTIPSNQGILSAQYQNFVWKISTVEVDLNYSIPLYFELNQIVSSFVDVSFLSELDLEVDYNVNCFSNCRIISSKFSNFVLNFSFYAPELYHTEISIIFSSQQTSFSKIFEINSVHPPEFVFPLNYLVFSQNSEIIFSTKYHLECIYTENFVINFELSRHHEKISCELFGEFCTCQTLIDISYLEFPFGESLVSITWHSENFRPIVVGSFTLLNMNFYSQIFLSIFQSTNIIFPIENIYSKISCLVDGLQFDSIQTSSLLTCLDVISPTYQPLLELQLFNDLVFIQSVILPVEAVLEEICFVSVRKFPQIMTSSFELQSNDVILSPLIVDNSRCCTMSIDFCSDFVSENSEFSVVFSSFFDVLEIILTINSTCALEEFDDVIQVFTQSNDSINQIVQSIDCNVIPSGFSFALMCIFDSKISNTNKLLFHAKKSFSLLELEFYGFPSDSCYNLVDFDTGVNYFGKKLILENSELVYNDVNYYSFEAFFSFISINYQSSIFPDFLTFPVQLINFDCFSSFLHTSIDYKRGIASSFLIFKSDFITENFETDICFSLSCFDLFNFSVSCSNLELTVVDSSLAFSLLNLDTNILIMKVFDFPWGINYLNFSSNFIEFNIFQKYKSELIINSFNLLPCNHSLVFTFSCFLIDFNFSFVEYLPTSIHEFNLSLSELNFELISSDFDIRTINVLSNYLEIIGFPNKIIELKFSFLGSDTLFSVSTANCSKDRIFHQNFCSCPLGTFLSLLGDCNPCPFNFYTENLAQNCISCPVPRVTYQNGSKSINDCLCPINFYDLYGSCLPCPNHATCHQGKLLTTAPGFIYNEDSHLVLNCPFKFYCQDNSCRFNSFGNNCNTCQDSGYYMVGFFCPKNLPILFSIVLFVVLIIITLIFDICLSRHSKHKELLVITYQTLGHSAKELLLPFKVNLLCPLLLFICLSLLLTGTVSALSFVLSYSFSFLFFDFAGMFSIILLLLIKFLSDRVNYFKRFKIPFSSSFILSLCGIISVLVVHRLFITDSFQSLSSYIIGGTHFAFFLVVMYLQRFTTFYLSSLIFCCLLFFEFLSYFQFYVFACILLMCAIVVYNRISRFFVFIAICSTVYRIERFVSRIL